MRLNAAKKIKFEVYRQTEAVAIRQLLVLYLVVYEKKYVKPKFPSKLTYTR